MQRLLERKGSLLAAGLLVAGLLHAPQINAACCYFSAKDMDITQPAQKVFITYDPMKGMETFTVQPKFEGNNYPYAGDQASLNFYEQKKWLYTVMKIDTMQMKKNKDGSYAGEVTPTRFSFKSDKLVYPLKITQISVKDKTEALFYVQAPYKVDLPGDMSYQHTWVPMLQSAQGCTPGGLPGGGEKWLTSIADSLIPKILKRNQELGFQFIAGQRPKAN